jgi:hypothetical protein
MPTTNTPSISQLQRAIEIKEQIEKLEGELKALLGSSVGGGTVSSAVAAPVAAKRGRPRKNKGGLSPEARERIAAAQRARWAKVKGTKVEAPAAATKSTGKRKKRRAVSPEARAKMAEAARRRWAAAKKS